MSVGAAYHCLFRERPKVCPEDGVLDMVPLAERSVEDMILSIENIG
jgi:hypothetical protein